METLFSTHLPDGRLVRLGMVESAQLECLTEQWQNLLRAGLDCDLLDDDARLEAEDQLEQGTLPDAERDALTCAPTWLVSEETQLGDGTCCEVSELGLILPLLREDERSEAASAHVAAIAHTAAHLNGAASWLLGEYDETGQALANACVACLCDPYQHARTLETALGGLGQQLALASVGWDLDVRVTPR